MKNPPKRNNAKVILPPIKRDDDYAPVGKKYICVVCKTAFWAEKKRSVCSLECRRVM